MVSGCPSAEGHERLRLESLKGGAQGTRLRLSFGNKLGRFRVRNEKRREQTLISSVWFLLLRKPIVVYGDSNR